MNAKQRKHLAKLKESRAAREKDKEAEVIALFTEDWESDDNSVIRGDYGLDVVKMTIAIPIMEPSLDALLINQVWGKNEKKI